MHNQENKKIVNNAMQYYRSLMNLINSCRILIINFILKFILIN